MANVKISQLPALSNVALTDVYPEVQAGTTYQATIQQLFNTINANTVLEYAGNPNGNLAGNTYQFCWDSLSSTLYVCTTSGSAILAVWTQVSANSGTFIWNMVSGTSATFAPNNGYIMNNTGLVTGTLPTTIAFGDVMTVVGYGAGGWKIAQNAGQQIIFGSSATTLGATGYLASTNANDNVELLCIVANTTFSVLGSPVGNLTVF
jgi:hypothetical protein